MAKHLIFSYGEKSKIYPSGNLLLGAVITLATQHPGHIQKKIKKITIYKCSALADIF